MLLPDFPPEQRFALEPKKQFRRAVRIALWAILITPCVLYVTLSGQGLYR